MKTLLFAVVALGAVAAMVGLCLSVANWLHTRRFRAPSPQEARRMGIGSGVDDGLGYAVGGAAYDATDAGGGGGSGACDTGGDTGGGGCTAGETAAAATERRPA